jgi:uncharacterized coiled-coil DUF342 family protein
MISEMLAQIQKLERRLDDVSNRVQTILDEGFGPEPVDTLESNLDLLEKKIYDTRFELSRLTGKLGDMHESNIVLGRERDEARELADSYRIAFCSANGTDKTPNPFPWEGGK